MTKSLIGGHDLPHFKHKGVAMHRLVCVCGCYMCLDAGKCICPECSCNHARPGVEKEHNA